MEGRVPPMKAANPASVLCAGETFCLSCTASCIARCAQSRCDRERRQIRLMFDSIAIYKRTAQHTVRERNLYAKTVNWLTLEAND